MSQPIQLNIANYKMLKDKKAVEMVRVGGIFALAAQTYDPFTKEPDDPQLVQVKMDHVDKAIKEAEDQLESLKLLKSDMDALSAPK